MSIVQKGIQYMEVEASIKEVCFFMIFVLSFSNMA